MKHVLAEIDSAQSVNLLNGPSQRVWTSQMKTVEVKFERYKKKKKKKNEPQLMLHDSRI